MRQQAWILQLFFLTAGSVAAGAEVFPVTPGATADLPDEVPGNGVCQTAAGTCTLRAAVQEANAFAGSDRIEVPAGVYALTIPGADEDSALTGDLDLTENLDLVGAGAQETILDGNLLDRVLDLHPGASVAIAAVTIRRGSAVSALPPGHLGGGLLVRGGADLDLTDCLVTGNAANSGGGLYALSGSTVTIAGCALRANDALDLGFVLAEGSAVANEGDTDLDLCEVSGNRAALAAGAVFSRGAVALGLRNTTIAGNDDHGVGVENTELDLVNTTLYENSGLGLSVFSAGTDTLSVRNTIVAASGAGDCSIAGIAAGNLDFAGEHNLSSDASCPNDGGGVDLPSTDPALGALLVAGGITRTHVPLVGSPVIDAGNDPRCEPGDQRGASRPLDGDGAGLPAAVCDIGAVEVLPCADDADELVTAETIVGTAEFEACFTLTVGPAVEVQTGAALTLRARDAVTLGEGFSMLGGSAAVILDPAAGSGLALP